MTQSNQPSDEWKSAQEYVQQHIIPVVIGAPLPRVPVIISDKLTQYYKSLGK